MILGDAGQVDWRGSEENRIPLAEKYQEDWLPLDNELGGMGLGRARGLQSMEGRKQGGQWGGCYCLHR